VAQFSQQATCRWADIPPQLQNRAAVVTGSNSGHGRAIAQPLAREGAAVICLDVRESALPEGFEEDIDVDTDAVIQGHGGRAEFIETDVAAVHNLTKAPAIECAPSAINVNAIAPGYFPTAMNRAFWDNPDALARVKELHPLPSERRTTSLQQWRSWLPITRPSSPGTILPVGGGVLVK
jgi:NAD(P)-dependent dehydrogenase (short-subunit alcohol dehydrogenase family)